MSKINKTTENCNERKYVSTTMELNHEAHNDQIKNSLKVENILNEDKENTSLEIIIHEENSIDNCVQNQPNNQMIEIKTLKGKAVKKKAKKERQKLKKMEKINQIKESNIDATETIQADVKELDLQKEPITDSLATTSTNVDQVKEDSKILSTTVNNMLEENDTTKVNLGKNNFSSSTLNNNNDEYNDVDIDNEFTLVKYKSTRHHDVLPSSKDLTTMAINLILENQITQSIKHLSAAINLDPKNVFHFINRSFCYLRAGAPSLAIKDANFVIKNTSDNTILAKANYLLAKAYSSLKNFEQAGKNIQKCLNLFPNNLSYIRESLHLKVSQLVDMGFCEREGLLALKNHESFTDAIETLIATSKMPKTNDGSIEDYDVSSMTYGDTENFYSDDEDNCSNTQLLSSIIKKKFPLCHDGIDEKSLIKKKMNKRKTRY